MLALLGTLVGAAQPGTLVQAAPPAQEGTDGTEGWGTFSLPAPDHGQLTPLVGEPRLAPEEQALDGDPVGNSRLPGPEPQDDGDLNTVTSPPDVPPTGGGDQRIKAPDTFTIFANHVSSQPDGHRHHSGRPLSPARPTTAASSSPPTIRTWRIPIDYGSNLDLL